MEPYFIITGHGRSGTFYMAALMRHFCYDVVHQNWGKDGSSSFHAGRAMLEGVEREWGLSRKRSDPGVYLFHVIRNPWKVVESDVGVSGSPSGVISDWFPPIRGKNALETSMRSVVIWNELLATLNPDLVVRVEEARPVVGGWLRKQGLFRGTEGEPPPKDANHIDHPALDQGSYKDIPKETMKMFLGHARKYGYEWMDK